MRIARLVLAAAGISAAATTGAVADDWSGGYVGIYGEGTFIQPFGFALGAPGMRAGYNFDMGDFVIGLEGSGQWYPSFGGFGEVQGTVRFGVDLGSTLVYGAAGGGWLTGPIPTGYWTIGTGLEAMVSDSISLRADYEYKVVPGGPVSHNFSGGISFYFGR